ncbi:unnamed protein product [Prorocentrum cordatum]|uniref:EF-hand domain-containing protein n=1 Tax=Prorocentrum cordatum TaxID=2364126 RepID=A0ABN9YB95_9DINO|nr:unnamed protein product [Polarella glacialis]
MAATRIKMHDDLIQKTFHRFDVDNSGFITRENLKQVLGDVFKEEEVDSIMADLDTSHDGQISYEEFFEYITHPEAHSNHHDIAAAVVDHHVSQSEDRAATARRLLFCPVAPRNLTRVGRSPERAPRLRGLEWSIYLSFGGGRRVHRRKLAGVSGGGSASGSKSCPLIDLTRLTSSFQHPTSDAHHDLSASIRPSDFDIHLSTSIHTHTRRSRPHVLDY